MIPLTSADVQKMDRIIDDAINKLIDFANGSPYSILRALKRKYDKESQKFDTKDMNYYINATWAKAIEECMNKMTISVK